MCLFWQPWYSFSRRQSLQSQTEKKETLYQQANHLWSKQRGEAGPLKCACVPFWGATGAARFDKNSILSRTLAVIQLSSCRVDPWRIDVCLHPPSHVSPPRISAWCRCHRPPLIRCQIRPSPPQRDFLGMFSSGNPFKKVLCVQRQSVVLNHDRYSILHSPYLNESSTMSVL